MLIIFDLDGTLADTDSEMDRIVMDILSRNGLKLTPEDFSSNYPFMGMGEFEKFESFSRKYGMGWSKQKILKMGWEHESAKQTMYEKNAVEPFDGVLESLRELKQRGHVMCIGSSNPSSRSRLFIEGKKLSDYFGERIYGQDHAGGMTKPDPSIFRVALEKHAALGPAIVVEDGLSGVEAAQALNIPVLLYDPYGRNPDWRVSGSFREYSRLPGFIRAFE